MNYNFDAHLIESRMRTQEADRRATLAASLGTLPRRPRFGWLRRNAALSQPTFLPQRQSETAASQPAKAA